ncbi:rRNA maturation RNase YbeY [Candidatus Microgenomates bacterium]|nr:rRNA maturation RNase YbeY [Candidatus Microgenomates bacterium]
MISVTVHKFGNFPISAKKVKETVSKVLTDHGMVSDCETSVAIVGREKMRAYVDEYYKDGQDHPVLSFPSTEMKGAFTMPPDNVIHLGEIIVSYPWCVEEAKKTNRLVDEVVCEMVEHGALHILGIHHD